MTQEQINARAKTLEEFKPENRFKKEWIAKDGLSQEVISYTNDFGFYLCKYEQKERFNKNTNKKEKFGNYELNKKTSLTNSQIRNIYGEVKRIQQKLVGQKDQEKAWQNEKSKFLLLQPKLAYAAGRIESKNKGAAITDFAKVLTTSLLAVDADNNEAWKRFQNFVDFFESILAYHKTYGGKNN